MMKTICYELNNTKN